MDLRTYHWTTTGKGPGGMVLLSCTVCGLLDTFLDYHDAVAEGREHSNDNNRKATR